MRLFTKLSLNDIKLNKKRSIVTIIGLILSVILITTTISVYSSLISSITSFVINNNGNFHVVFYDVPSEKISDFKKNSQINNINLVENIGYAKIRSRNENKPYVLIKAFSEESINDLSIKLIEGRLPKNDKEILIPSHLETNAGLELKVGDYLTLDIGSRTLNQKELDQFDEFNTNEDLVNLKEDTYKIVGIMEKPSLFIEDSTSPSYTLITQRENLNNSKMDLYIRYTKSGEKNLYKVTGNFLGINSETLEKIFKGKYTEEEYNSLATEMNKAKYTISINDKLVMLETNPLKDDDIRSITNVVLIIAFIIVLTSVFCIKNSFEISMYDKMKNFGILASVGATKKQIRKCAIYEAFILGLIAIPIGIIFAVIVTYFLIKIGNIYFTHNIINGITLVYNFSILSIIISVVISLLTIYLSSIKSAKKVSKISPIRVIRKDDNIDNEYIKDSKIINKIFGISGAIAYKNVKRNKKKYRIIILSLVIAITTFNVLTSSFDLIFKNIKTIYNTDDYNIHYSINVTDNDLLYRKVLSTTQLDNIDRFSIVRSMGARIITKKNNNDNYVNINVLGNKEYKNYIRELGLKYDDIKDKIILIDYSKSCIYDEKKDKNICENNRTIPLEIGDNAEIITDNNKRINLKLGFVTDKKPFSLKKEVNSMAIISDELYDSLIQDKTYLSVYFYSPNSTTLQKNINEILKNYNYNLNNVDDQVKNMQNFYKLIAIFLYIFIGAITLIDLTTIFNTITTNIEFRKQEFAIFRSIGMTSREFNNMIKFESIFIGIKTIVYSLPTSIILCFIVYNTVNSAKNIKFNLPFTSILISLIFVSVLIYTIMKHYLNKLNNQNIIETIRNDNI